VRVLIVDQFSGVSPYALAKTPVLFEELAAEAIAAGHPWTKPEVKDVPDDFVPRMATTLVAADANGYAYVWRARWDTSG